MDLSEAQLRSSIAIDASRNTRQATTLLVYRSAQMRAKAAVTREQSLYVRQVIQEQIARCGPPKRETVRKRREQEPDTKVAA